MKKKLFWLLAALVETLCLLTVSAGASYVIEGEHIADGTCGENLTWTLIDSTLIISGTGPMDEFSDERESTPWWLYADNIHSVYMEDGVTSVSDYAFLACPLEVVTFSKNLTHIGKYAFANSDFQELALPDSLQYLGEGAFYNCQELQELDMGKGVFEIGADAFSDCISLLVPKIPYGVTKLPDGMFRNCDLLYFIVIPATVTEIGENAFANCYALESVFYGGTWDMWCDVAIGDGNDCLQIGDPEKDGPDFYPMPGLSNGKPTNLICGVPISVRQTTGGTVSVDKPMAAPYEIVTVTAEANEGYELTCVLVNGAEIEGTEFAAYESDGITVSAVFTKTNTTPGVIASGECGDNLTWAMDDMGTLTISGTGNMDDFSTFSAPWDSHATNILQVTMENGVTSVGDYAFYICTNLETITIPDSVTSIGKDVFTNTLYYNLDSNWENSRVLYIGNHLIKAKTGISRTYAIKNGTKTIADSAFSMCRSLTGITIPDSVISIGSEAFSLCSRLTSIAIGNGVSSIGTEAFYCCSNLASVTIPNSVTSIGELAFSECESLADVYYAGTRVQWNAISIGSNNTELTNATIHFTEPEEPEVAVEVEGATPQFTIDTSALTGTDNYAVITVGGKTERVEQADWADGTVSYGSLAAKDLTQTVTMGVYDGEGTLLAEQSVSVADALKEQLKTETDTKEITKIKAMLHYGAAAQQYFGTNTENLANSGIGTMADVSAHRKDDSLLKGKDFSMICGTSMVHEAVPQMKFYFTTDSKTVLVNGEEVELEASAAGYYTYTVDVAPEAFFETITVTVMDGDTVLATITDSVASYCARLHAQGGTLSKTLADALLNYGLAVKA